MEVVCAKEAGEGWWWWNLGLDRGKLLSFVYVCERGNGGRGQFLCVYYLPYDVYVRDAAFVALSLFKLFLGPRRAKYIKHMARYGKDWLTGGY